MNNKRWIALLLSLILCLPASLSSVFAVSEVSFSVECSTPTGENPAVGDHLTYTVKITENIGGFVGGTFFFRPSDNLSYVSATLRGEAFTATKVEAGSGENADEDVLDNVGAYGIEVMDDLFEESGVDYCTITFRVTDVGQTSLDCYIYQFNDGSSERRVELGEICHTVAEPSKPTVLTETLKKAVLGQSYTFALEGDPAGFLTWRVADDSSLPEGLSLSEDGVLSGTPTVFGDFTFKVVASAPGGIDSDPKELTLTVLEKPQKLELTAESTYVLGEDGYLRKMSLQTSLSTLLSHFESNSLIEVRNVSGNVVTSSTALIGTGYTVNLMDNDAVVDTITVVVRGDISGDGRIGMIDYSLLVSHLKYTDLLGAPLEAAKIAGNRTVGMIDYSKLVSFLRDGVAF